MELNHLLPLCFILFLFSNILKNWLRFKYFKIKIKETPNLTQFVFRKMKRGSSYEDFEYREKLKSIEKVIVLPEDIRDTIDLIKLRKISNIFSIIKIILLVLISFLVILVYNNFSHAPFN